MTAEHTANSRTSTKADGRVAIVLGVALVVVAALIANAVWNVWPAVEDVAARGARRGVDPPETRQLDDVAVLFGQLSLEVSEGQAYLLLIAVFGASGAFIHTATSFSTYVGNKEFRLSWAWWYLFRVVVGSFVALILLVAVLGGLVTVGSNSSTIDPQALNPYAVAALAGLGGWFSKAATDKLEEIFEVIFSNGNGSRRKDPLSSERPSQD